MSYRRLAQWAAVSGFASLLAYSRRPFGLGTCALTAQQAKLDSDKFGDEAGDQTGGLIESCTRLNFPLGTYLVDFKGKIHFVGIE